MPEFIAIRSFDLVDPDGERSRVTVKFGLPYPKGKSYRCKLVIEGGIVLGSPGEIWGNDHLQALTQAVAMVRGVLRGLVNDGFQMQYDDTGEMINVDRWEEETVDLSHLLKNHLGSPQDDI